MVTPAAHRTSPTGRPCPMVPNRVRGLVQLLRALVLDELVHALPELASHRHESIELFEERHIRLPAPVAQPLPMLRCNLIGQLPTSSMSVTFDVTRVLRGHSFRFQAFLTRPA
ncbi:hypothetical protein SSPO_099840 [Streptomyces antimycoticus]|uniref:Uncharacterized protein n=1 Tax=Streptomyces antimycoticus TaxID=68175 RepID=A0A499VGF3_9ACTN|nr:hypothetical protein SSPO_099840 [Streptomyces antimycoticus]